MNKFTYVTALLLLTCFSIKAQINTQKLTPLQKAEKFLNAKEEIYFSFEINDQKEIKAYTHEFSIVNYEPSTKTLIAWANRKQFEAFLQKGIPYNVDGLENEPTERLMSNQLNNDRTDNNLRATPLTFPLTAYPTYQDYADQMALFATNNPSICQLIDIGGTTEGAGGGNKRLLFIKLSDNVSVQEQEPRVMYTSSMHGDEIAGYPLMLNLIDYFITAYVNTGHADHARVKNLIDNSEVWINPSANPDGTYYNDPTNTSVANARRANDNSIDLNRNYPDNIIGPHANGHTAYELETQHFMSFEDTYKFVLSANFHGGTEVVNYAWDNTSTRHADDAWLFDISKEYAVNCQNDAFSYNGDTNYMDAEYTNFVWPGVTNGNDWYEVYGGRQDYMNYYKLCKETTLELSNVKTPPASELVNLWNWNREALIDYLVQGTYGFTGVVKDASTNNPIEATITLVGHDSANSHTTSESTFGDYYRPVKAGTYDILFEAPCYQSFTLTNQTITDYQTKVLSDVLLTAGVEIPSGITPSSLNPISANILWNAQAENTFDLRYRETGSPTWTDVTDQSTNSYNITGLTISTEYEVQVRSKCDSFTSNYSSSTVFTTPSVSYCNSSGNTNTSTGITYVSFSTIMNADTNKNIGYEDFTNLSTNVARDDSHNLTVRVNTNGNKRVHAFAWFDWNGDGDFLDTGETVDIGDVKNVTDGATSLSPVSVTIPASAAIGTVRMRISAKFNSDPSSCETNFDGEVEDYTINITLPPNETIADGYWNEAATWLYGIPLATHDVTINNAITIAADANATINDLTVGTGSLTINSGGSLIVDGTSSGDITYNVAITDINWHFVSSPVTGEQYDATWIADNLIDDTTGGGTNVGIGTYTNTTDANGDWTYVTDGGSGNLNNGQGYAILRDATGSDLSFIGAVNTDNFLSTIDIANLGNAEENRWNLVGNPYPSYVLVSDLITANSANLTDTHEMVYGWNGTSYIALNSTDHIHPGQGFFVNADNSNANNFTITETLQSHQTGVTFYRSTSNDPSITLMMTDGNEIKSTEINYLTDKTTGLDPSFDVGTFTGQSTSFSVYSHLVSNSGGVDFMRQALPQEYENMVIPVGINATSGTEITISASSVNLPAGLDIYLEDKDNNTFTLLDAVSDFTTTLPVDLSGIGRFYLHTTSSSLGLNVNLLSYNLQIYTTTSPKELIVKGQLSGDTAADLYDLQGRLILSNKLDRYSTKNTIDVSNISTGKYVVKVDNGNQNKTQKVIIK